MSFIFWVITGIVFAALLAGCTTFGRISWRNTMIALRAPDSLPNRVSSPARPEARLAVLWIGHSTVLIQLEDKFILTDPVFTRYIGGISARLVGPGIAPEDLPSLDAILISHRHFDHLSKGSFPLMQRKIGIVLAPPGVANDVPPGPYHVTELSAWQVWERDGLRITAVPVRHSGGRMPFDENSHANAFTGFVVEYHDLVVFFAGDTAYDEQVFRAIGVKFPHIDLALMPIGPIKPESEMLPHHLNPVQALLASEIMGAKQMLPVHFGTFIISLDRPGEVEAAFAQILNTRGGKIPAASLWRIGEQRVLLGK